MKTKLADLVPPGVVLRNAWEAAEAAGFEKREVVDGEAHFYCCGEHAQVSNLLGPYRMYCERCGKAIRDIGGPAFGTSWVAFPDPDKVEFDPERTWFVESEWPRETHEHT